MDDVLFDEEGNLIEEKELPSTEEKEESQIEEKTEKEAPPESEEEEHQEPTSEEEELDAAETDAEREAIRARRRLERQNKKQAAREREETLRRELASRDAIINELRSRVDQIDKRNNGSELAQLENAKTRVAQGYNFYKEQIRVATEAGNGAAVAEATERLIQSQRQYDELVNRERMLKSRQAAPQTLDPRMVNQAQSWMTRNSWYDPSAKDQDSEIVLKIDQRLAEEGWDPTTPQYWEELDSRVKKYLPHRVNRGKISNTKPRSVVTGSGRDTSAAGKPGTYKLSAERVQALKDAGMWDDPDQRKEAIKRFREFDKQNQE